MKGRLWTARDTGEFKEDMTYTEEINFNYSGDVEEMSKVDFDKYVAMLKKEKEFL